MCCCDYRVCEEMLYLAKLVVVSFVTVDERDAYKVSSSSSRSSRRHQVGSIMFSTNGM